METPSMKSAPHIALITLLAVNFPVGPLRTQQTPTPISPATMRGRSLHALTDTMNIVLVRDGVRKSSGRFIVSLTQLSDSGRRFYVAVAHDLSPSGANTFDTVAVDATTLAPLWHRSHAPTDSAAVAYRHGAASGYAAHQNQPRAAVQFRLSNVAFEGAIVSWLLPALPLQADYAVAVTSFSLWDNTESTATYRVTGSEMLQLRGGPTDTWIIQEQQGPNDKAMRKQWIDKRTGRTLQTYDAPPRPAAPGDGYWKISTLVKTAAN